jgi:hypothetical protein
MIFDVHLIAVLDSDSTTETAPNPKPDREL